MTFFLNHCLVGVSVLSQFLITVFLAAAIGFDHLDKHLL